MLLKMLHDDLLLTENSTLHSKSSLYLPAPTKQNSRVLFYTVHAVGEEAKDVRVGDIIGVAWADTVPSFTVESVTYTLTSEKKAMFIVRE